MLGRQYDSKEALLGKSTSIKLTMALEDHIATV